MPSKRETHLGYYGVWPKADHDVGLSLPSCLESGPWESNLAIKGHPEGAQDHSSYGQTRPIVTFG